MKPFLPDSISSLSHAYLLEGNEDHFFEILQSYFKRHLHIEDLSNHVDCTVISCQGMKVDKLREILRNLNLNPYFEKKIIILRSFQEANPSIQNALLKSLEDPPDYGVFFLLCTHTQQVLPTILSRCRCIYEADLLPKIEGDGLLKLLEEKSFYRLMSLCELGKLEREELMEKLDEYFQEVHQAAKSKAIRNLESGKSSVETSFNASTLIKIASAILTAQKRLGANCSIKASIDAMVFQIMEVKS